MKPEHADQGIASLGALGASLADGLTEVNLGLGKLTLLAEVPGDEQGGFSESGRARRNAGEVGDGIVPSAQGEQGRAALEEDGVSTVSERGGDLVEPGQRFGWFPFQSSLNGLFQVGVGLHLTEEEPGAVAGG